MFITFEGIDGSGKTTQMNRLKKYLSSISLPVVSFREPGAGCPELREMILSGKFKNQCSDLLAFFVDRLENITKNIQPALDKNQIVLCDRYIDSTYVYQSCKGIEPTFISFLTRMLGCPVPDKTFYFDIEPEEAAARIIKRGGKSDKYEASGIEYMRKLREEYLKLTKSHPRFSVIKDCGKRTEGDIFSEIKRRIAASE